MLVFSHLNVSSVRAGTFSALVALFLSPRTVLDDSRYVFLMHGFSTSALSTFGDGHIVVVGDRPAPYRLLGLASAL